jgi:hypothetical protein
LFFDSCCYIVNIKYSEASKFKLLILNSLIVRKHTLYDLYTFLFGWLVLGFFFFLIFCFVVVFFWWDWSLNSGLHTCKAGILLLESYLQSILLWLFWRWALKNYLHRLASNAILLISVSQVAGITGRSQQCLAF